MEFVCKNAGTAEPFEFVIVMSVSSELGGNDVHQDEVLDGDAGQATEKRPDVGILGLHIHRQPVFHRDTSVLSEKIMMPKVSVQVGLDERIQSTIEPGNSAYFGNSEFGAIFYINFFGKVGH